MLVRRSVSGTGGAAIVVDALADAETRRRLFSTARARVRTAEDAEDCVQEALLLAVSAAEGYRGRGSLRSWLVQIVVNVCRMRHRSGKRLRRGGEFTLCSLSDVPEWGAECHLSPERLLAARQELATVDAHLANEHGLDAQLLKEFVSREISITDLAHLYGISRESVKTRLFRVRRRLRGGLVENEGSRAA